MVTLSYSAVESQRAVRRNCTRPQRVSWCLIVTQQPCMTFVQCSQTTSSHTLSTVHMPHCRCFVPTVT